MTRPNAAHWRAVHLAGDRNPPIALVDRPKNRTAFERFNADCKHRVMS